MIGGDDDVGRGGEAEIVQRLAQLGEIVVGVLDAGHRGRPVDAGGDGVEAVAGIVLAAVGIARPEHQHERLVARLEHRQHDLGRDVGHVGLLRDVGAVVPGVLASPALPFSPRGGVASGRLALVSASFISSDSGTPFLPPVESSITIGVLADRRYGRKDRSGRACRWRRCEKPLRARHLQNGFFVQIVAVEMLVDVAEHGVVFDEGHDGVAGRHGRIAGVDRVAEGAGIAEVMAAGHRRAVRHGEGRKQRMRVLEIDALVADFGHRRRGLRRHDAPAQAVRHEQDQVARAWRFARTRRWRQARSGRRTATRLCGASNSPPQEAVPAIRRRSRLVLLCDRIVTLCGTGLKGRGEGNIAA